MRFEIIFDSMQPIRLPIQYNYVVQGMIYKHLGHEYSSQLHDEGYTYQNRNFKLFTFSRLNGRFKQNRESNEILFYPPVALTISSSIERFAYELGYSLLTSDDLHLGDNPVKVSGFNALTEPIINPLETIGMLSPITVYSTLRTQDNKAKTYYYSPYEQEFSQLIESNLKKKFTLIHNKNPEDEQTISIKPLKVSKNSEVIIKYKETIIKAWRGVYILEGDHELIKVGYDSGLGSKNSQGFGCFKFLTKGDNYD
jgi:CRISPR-associated endoribonuclease Cas6